VAYGNLQTYLAALDAAGKLHHIKAQVDPGWEVGAITREVFARYGWADRQALYFEKVGSSDYPLVVGAIGGSPSIYAMAMGVDEDHIAEAWEKAQREPLDPVRVETGLCKEVIACDAEVDITILPNSVWTPELDPGPFITAGLVITRDPESGARNVGTYRLQVKGPRKLGVYMGPAQHGSRHVRKYQALKQDMPVAIALGADPAVVLCSATKFGYGTDEFKVAGGLRGEPLPVVKAETVDLEVPADAEIVLEGVIHPDVREEEGPFGEYTGYLGVGGLSPVIELHCMTRRRKPVYHAFLSQMPPSESSCIRSLGRAASLFRHLKGVLGFPVTDVHLPESGGANGSIVVAMRKEYPQQVRELAYATWGYMNKEGKVLTVVDDDIDIRNPFEVDWAVAFRVQPDRDVLIASDVVAMGLDPSIVPVDVPQHDPRRRVGSKMLVDATRKHEYPDAAQVPAKHLDAVRQRWTDYGFD